MPFKVPGPHSAKDAKRFLNTSESSFRHQTLAREAVIRVLRGRRSGVRLCIEAGWNVREWNSVSSQWVHVVDSYFGISRAPIHVFRREAEFESGYLRITCSAGQAPWESARHAHNSGRSYGST